MSTTNRSDQPDTTAPILRAVAAAIPWVARAAWVLVAVVGGTAIQSALAERSDAVTWTASFLAWAGWAVVALALAVASTLSLTAVRVGTPLAIVATVAAGFGGASAADLALLGVPAAIAVAAVFAPELGRRYVQSSAYGDELRFPLRPPAAAGVAAVAVWVLWAPTVVAGPLLLASRQWIAGVVVTLLAIAGSVLLAPRWHRLSRRGSCSSLPVSSSTTPSSSPRR